MNGKLKMDDGGRMEHDEKLKAVVVLSAIHLPPS